MLVLFFYCMFSFPMYVKRPKINTRVSCHGGSVVQCLHCTTRVRVRLPVRRARYYFLTLFSIFFQSLLYITFMVSFSLNVSFRATVKFNMQHKSH